MKDRILKGWTFQRGLYLVLGLFLMIHSAIDGLWPGILFGGYFAAMGFFAFGCAGGNCANRQDANDERPSKETG